MDHNEIWVEVKGTYYLVSNYGNFKNTHTGRVFSGYVDKSGYKIVSLYYIDIQKKRTRLAHRVIWEAFKGLIPSGYEIDHINADKLNNNILNLQLLTHVENARKNKNHVLRKHRVICMFDKQGNLIKKFKNGVEAAEYVGGLRNHIHWACKHSTQNNYKGYKWQYEVK